MAVPALATTAASVKPVSATATHFLREATPKNTANAGISALDASTAPPTTAQCLAAIGVPCYGPTQIARAYGQDTAQKRGFTGAGSTIVLVENYGSPTVQADLNAFDAAYGLPAATVTTVKYGTWTVDQTDVNQRGWGEETAGDVEWAHAEAPGAKLVVLAAAPDQTWADLGMGNLSAAMAWYVDHYPATVMSASWGMMEASAAELTGSQSAGNALLKSPALRAGLEAAARHHVSVMVATGDDGPTGPNLSGSGNGLYPFATVSWPASDPAVTGVGGTQLNLDANGNRTSADTAWSLDRIGGAGGAGLSATFARPEYQNGVTNVVGTQRGVADFAAEASCNSPVVIYSYDRPNPALHGWARVCGTSLSAPIMAGFVADGAALVHHPLGNIDDILYGLSAHQRARGIADVTSGCTTDFGVTGYCAGKGYDLATGWGTVGNASELIRTLAYAGRE